MSDIGYLIASGFAGLGRGIAGGLHEVGARRREDDERRRLEEEKEKQEAKETKALRAMAEVSGILTKDQADTMDLSTLRGTVEGTITAKKLREFQAAEMQANDTKGFIGTLFNAPGVPLEQRIGVAAQQYPGADPRIVMDFVKNYMPSELDQVATSLRKRGLENEARRLTIEEQRVESYAEQVAKQGGAAETPEQKSERLANERAEKDQASALAKKNAAIENLEATLAGKRERLKIARADEDEEEEKKLAREIAELEGKLRVLKPKGESRPKGESKQGASQRRVKVISPEGVEGTVPEHQVEAFRRLDYTIKE
jgi:hypothetical protein